MATKPTNAVAVVRNKPGPKPIPDETYFAVCDLIADGKSVRAASAEAGISHQSVFNKIHTDPQIFDSYSRARKIRADDLAERCIEIVDKVERGAMPSDAGRTALSGLQWLASKFGPDTYGDRTRVAVEGPPRDTTPDYSNLSSEELEAFQQLLDKASGRALPAA